MRFRHTWPLLFLVTASLALAQAKGDDSAAELKKFEGSWVMVSGKKDGQALPADQVGRSRITWKGAETVVETPHQAAEPIKAKVALANGTSERAIEAFSRAYTLGSAKPYKDKMYGNIKGAYKLRFAKEEGIDAFIAEAGKKPFQNPLTPVTPISDPEPVTTTTTTSTTPPAPAPIKPAGTPAKPAGTEAIKPGTPVKQ